MKSYQRVVIFLLAVLFGTALLSPWVALLLNFIAEAWPSWPGLRQPFNRVFDRLFMSLGIVLFFLFRPLLKINSLNQLGFPASRQGSRDLLAGFSVAWASVGALVIAMSLSEIFAPYFRLALPIAAGRSLTALLAAFTVAFLEEIFFRGLLFKGLLDDGKPVAAFLAANLFYSAIHFFKPGENISTPDAWSGIRHLVYFFQPFLEPGALVPGLFGLFLMGIALSYAFFQTHSLYLSIGLHAGWVFGIKTIRVFGDYQRENLGWIFGSTDPKLVSGVGGWIGILAVGIIVHWITRKRQRQRIENRR